MCKNTDINKEFCLTYGEVAEAYEAWRKKKDDLGEELADVAIYLLGLSEILNIDLCIWLASSSVMGHHRWYLLRRCYRLWCSVCQC